MKGISAFRRSPVFHENGPSGQKGAHGWVIDDWGTSDFCPEEKMDGVELFLVEKYLMVCQNG
jgi:hypothetical protein